MGESTTSEITLREIVTNSIGYWEKRRLTYNLALAMIVAAVFVLYWPTSVQFFSDSGFSGPVAFIVLAVLANIAYCAAYPVDIVLQFSDFRVRWLSYRWMLFGGGVLLASVLAFWFALQFFRPFV